MRTYSAVESISPAIERTRQFLLQPFRLGRFLKLTLVGLIAEGGMSSCNFSSNWDKHMGHGGGSASPLHMPHIPWPGLGVVIGIVIAFLVVMIPLWLLIGYLVSRLRFTYFDCVLNLQDQIAPAWARYHRQAMRYLGLVIVIGLGFIVLVGLSVFGIYSHFKPLFQSIGSDHPPNFFDFLPLIAAVVPLVLLLAVAGTLIDGIANYFVLPRMALEDASISDALTDVWGDIQDETWQFLLFFLLRFLVTLLASIAGVIALAVPLVIVVLLAAAIGFLLKTISMALVFVFAIPAGIVIATAVLLALIGLGGTIGTFRRSYALFFYGGRYPLLGAILGPQLPAPAPPWAGAMPSPLPPA